jgi:hypothetical protein
MELWRMSDSNPSAWQLVEVRACRKLGRSLTTRERSSLRDAGSLHMLEPVERFVERAQRSEEIAMMLARLADSFEARRREAGALLADQLAGLLQRSLTDQERQMISLVPTVGGAIRIGDEIAQTLPEMREAFFKEVLAALESG